MAFDYSLRFTGQDDLSGVLGKVKKEIKDMGKEASNVELVDKAMGKIITSSGKLNTKVRQTSALLAEMKFDGDHNAAQFLSMAKAAGEAKDAIGDTQAMIKFFADDRRWLNTTVQGFQALAGVGSIAAGAMSLFGVESENATRAIQGCQTALSILNGITTVANLLDKEGYLMTAKKVLGLQAEAAAETKVTTTTNAATASQIRFNAAVLANPYVIAAAALAALVTGLVAWSRAMSDADEKLIQIKEDAENHKSAVESQNQTLAENITKFRTLQDRWNSLGNDLNAKKKFVVDNKEEFKNLGYEVNTVSDAEDVLVKNSNLVIAGMRYRADATAAQIEMVQNLKKEYDKLATIEEKISKGEALSQEELADLNIKDPQKDKRLQGAAYSHAGLGSLWGSYGTYRVKPEYQTEIIDAGYDAAEKRAHERNKKLEKRLQKDQEELAKIPHYNPYSSMKGGSGRSGSSTRGRGSSGSSSGSSGSGSSTNNDKKGLINDYEKKIQELKEKVNSAETEKDLAEAVKELNDKEKEFTDFKIRVGLEVDPELKNKEEAEKKAKEQAETLYENFQNTMNEVAGRYSIGTFDKLIGDNPFNTNSLEGLRRMIDATEGSLQKLKKQKKEFEDAGNEGSEAYQKIIDKIKELEEELAKLGILVIKTSEEDEALKRRKKQIEAIGDSFAALGSIMSSLGQMTDDKALNAGAIIAQAIATYILGWSEATAKAAAAGPLGWVAFGLSTAAQLAAMIAQIHSLSGYASGGIISGGSYYGDQILARVNAGEMVLNRKQQSNLFRAIESGNIGAGQTVLVPEFKIKGSDLYGTLRNFSKSVGKTGKVTGIR